MMVDLSSLHPLATTGHRRMFPTHLPSSALPRLLKDFAGLIEKDCDPGTDPLMWLGGCDPEKEHGFLPYEGDPEEEEMELDPVKRLDGGEELAIRLHTAFVGDEMTLIDGEPYMPLGGPTDDDDEEDGPGEDDEYYDFPSEMSFYALGVKRDGDKLRVRPVGMNECSNPGGSFHRSGIAEFPKSFQDRIEKYLALLQ
jgi:hypothetical protein